VDASKRGGKQSKSKRQKAMRGHIITRHVTPKGALVRKVVQVAAIEVEVVFLQATCIYLNISITQANYRVIDCNKRKGTLLLDLAVDLGTHHQASLGIVFHQ
jgi:hypothetical protein